MNLQMEVILSMRLLIAALLGAAVGYEREIRGQDAGVGTFAIVSLGACAFAIVSDLVVKTPSADNTRIAAAVVSGIGFLGAGIILRLRKRVSGLTTAAALWTVSAIGLATGFGLYLVAGTTTAICVLILVVRHIPPISRRLEGDERG